MLKKSASCANKSAVIAADASPDTIRHELLDSPVGVTVVHPGGVATNIARRARLPADAPPADVQAGLAQAEKMLRLPPEKAAATILRAIETDRARVLVGGDAHFIALLERLLPVRYWSVLARLLPT